MMVAAPHAPPPPPSDHKGRMSLKDYLAHLLKLATGYEFERNGVTVKVGADRLVRNFLDHHKCTGVWNGSPVWRRQPSFYDRGKKYRLVGGST